MSSACCALVDEVMPVRPPVPHPRPRGAHCKSFLYLNEIINYITACVIQNQSIYIHHVRYVMLHCVYIARGPAANSNGHRYNDRMHGFDATSSVMSSDVEMTSFMDSEDDSRSVGAHLTFDLFLTFTFNLSLACCLLFNPTLTLTFAQVLDSVRSHEYVVALLQDAQQRENESQWQSPAAHQSSKLCVSDNVTDIVQKLCNC